MAADGRKHSTFNFTRTFLRASTLGRNREEERSAGRLRGRDGKSVRDKRERERATDRERAPIVFSQHNFSTVV